MSEGSRWGRSVFPWTRGNTIWKMLDQAKLHTLDVWSCKDVTWSEDIYSKYLNTLQLCWRSLVPGGYSVSTGPYLHSYQTFRICKSHRFETCCVLYNASRPYLPKKSHTVLQKHFRRLNFSSFIAYQAFECWHNRIEFTLSVQKVFQKAVSRAFNHGKLGIHQRTDF